MKFKAKFKNNLGKFITIAFFALFAFMLFLTYLIRKGPTDSFRIMCVIVGIVVLGLVMVEFFLAYIKEWPIHRLYLVAGLVMGLIYMFIIPTFTTPDENAHSIACVHVSNVIMGYGEPDGENMVYMRNTERDAQVFTQVKREQYNAFLGDFSLTTTKAEREITAVNRVYPWPHILYLIGGIGITVGRLLGFSGVASFLLATLLNMLFFVITTALAIKIIPFGKEVLMVVALFPMVLQETSSLSYDNATLASIIMIIAIGLKWSYAKDLSVTKKEIVAFLFYGVMLCLVKRGVYVMFIFLPFICNSSKNTIKNICAKYKTWIVIGGFLLLCVMGRGFIISAFHSIFMDSSTGATQTAVTGYNLWDNNYIEWANAPGFSIKQFIHDPMLLIYIIVNTFVNLLSYYTSSLIAGPLGWIVIDIPWFYVICYVVILFMATIKVDSEPVYFKTRDRVWILILGVLSIGLASAAMLMFWTPNTYDFIAGIQGRYYIPPAIIMVMAARNNLITTKKKMTYGILISLLILSMFTVFYILRAALI